MMHPYARVYRMQGDIDFNYPDEDCEHPIQLKYTHKAIAISQQMRAHLILIPEWTITI